MFDWKTIFKKKEPKGAEDLKFGTFNGVFVPNILTILGVIVFLRLSWVIGNAGLLGGIAIILLGHLVTICTSLSMASVVTNAPIGHGGTYAMISRSLGLEVGGAVGIPLYFSITLGVAFYIIGFTEGWISIFPDHNFKLVASIVWLVLLIVSYISAQMANKIQIFILVAIGISLLSLFTGHPVGDPETVLIGPFTKLGFWQTFAIFFPAVTGIEAGINMSGELKDSSTAIPVGAISSVLTGLVVYLILAVFVSRMAAPLLLQNDYMVMNRISIFSPLITMGIFAATVSSALASLVGAPRILATLGEDGVVPFGKFFSKRSATMQPRNAVLFSALMAEGVILIGNLDMVASLLTMFFLITYGVINMVVFIEESIGITSFRPTFRVHRFIPLTGSLVCIFFMLVINAPATFVALGIIAAIYALLVRRELKSQTSDVRWGLFWALAAWAARQAATMPRQCITWKPDMLIPVEDPLRWKGIMSFVYDLVHPGGSVTAFNICDAGEREQKSLELKELMVPMELRKQFVASMAVVAPDFHNGAITVIQTINGTFFRPNVLFITLGDDGDNDGEIIEVINVARNEGLGVVILKPHPKIGMGQRFNVNVWLRDKTPNWNLALLMALRISDNWKGRISLLTSVPSSDLDHANKFLEYIIEHARMPRETRRIATDVPFPGIAGEVPNGDISIFGLSEPIVLADIRKVAERVDTSCLFVRDSGGECVFV